MNQQPTTKDKIDLAVIDHNRRLESAKKELNNENLTPGQIRSLHVEIAELKFSLKTLNFIKYD